MTRPGKAVETAALWKPWKWTHREADQRIRFFSTVTTALGKRARAARLVSHSYTPLLLLDTQTDSIRNASRGPESTEAVNQRPPHGHTAHCSRAACRTASPQRASRGIEMSRTQRI